MLVRIIKYWNDLDILRQTPGSCGNWRGVDFIADEPGIADYIIIHCHAGNEPVWVQCPPENIWLVLGEPPNENFKNWHTPPQWITRTYGSDISQDDERYIVTPLGLPWHVNKSYDFLSTTHVPEKKYPLSWITSNRTDSLGHRKRMATLKQLTQIQNLHLFGRGFDPIDDKWDGLASYRYSIAYENFQSPYYWTEKVMDCFLAWTMPIYYGCTQLHKFFPKDSFVELNPDDANLNERVADIIQSDLRERNLAAIAEARDLVLHKYNFFELVVSEIERHQQKLQGDNLTRQSKRTLVYDHTVSIRRKILAARLGINRFLT